MYKTTSCTSFTHKNLGIMRMQRICPFMAVMTLSTIIWSVRGAEGAIIILNQATSHFTVTVISPCLQYKVVYKKEPVGHNEEFVNVRECHNNFAVFTITATRQSPTVDIEDGSYVVVEDSPGGMATITGYLLDSGSHSVLSMLFSL